MAAANAGIPGIGYNSFYSQVQEGAGVPKPGKEDPEELEDVWPKIAEPALQRKHEAPIQKVDDASMRSLFWSLGGLGAMAGGIGVAAAVQDAESGTAATIAAVSGLALGLVGVEERRRRSRPDPIS